MSSSNTVISHPLRRDGKSQAERRNLRALAPDSVSLDGRTEQELLAYLYEYAKSIAYYDEQLKVNGNWQDFLGAGVSVQAALVSQYNVEQWRGRFESLLNYFSDGLHRGDFSPLLDFLFDTALGIESWHAALANDTALVNGQLVYNENALRSTIRNLIGSNLRPNLLQLIAIANVWSDKPTASGRRNYDLPQLTSLQSDRWGLEPAALSARDLVMRKLLRRPDDFVVTMREKIKAIFQVFSNVVIEIVAAAQSLDVTPPTQTHDPHLGLLYAFLRLFETLQGELNGLTKRHLDFYYRDVLGLRPKPHVPDVAHVVFELTKPFPTHRLIANTRLKDSKDAKGAEIRFGLKEEIIINRAQVQTLRTIFKNQKLYSAPKANSADGQGGEFKDPNNATWASLGQINDSLPARVGFMVASPLLRLATGSTRNIKLTITSDTALDLKTLEGLSSYQFNDGAKKFFKENKSLDPNKLSSRVYVGTDAEVAAKLEEELGAFEAPVTAADLLGSFEKTGLFTVEFSGKKGWFKPANAPTYPSEDALNIELRPKEEDIMDADRDALKTDFGVSQPLMRLTLNPYILKDGSGLYQHFKDTRWTAAKLTVTVSDLMNPLVRTEEGPVDATKPFMPFGAVPGMGAKFWVDHPAFYGQAFTACSLTFEWDKLPASFADLYYYKSGVNDAYFKTSVKFGTQGQQTGVTLFNDVGNSKSAFACPVTSPQQVFLDGPVEFYLENDFFHSIYPQMLATQTYINNHTADLVVLNRSTYLSLRNGIPFTIPDDLTADCNLQLSNVKAKIFSQVRDVSTALMPVVPLPPYTPVIKSVNLSYTVETRPDNLTLFHLHPFEDGNHEKVALNDFMLPQFDDEGTLLIGLSDAVPGGTLNLLFQLLESSADPYLAEADIKWHYLQGNQWNDLLPGTHILDDDTHNLIRSGIVQLALPFEIDQRATILPSNYYWIKVSAPNRTGAVCRTISIHAQAAKAIFVAEEANDFLRLQTPLPAGSLSKLLEADAAIKGIQQPYQSFDGRPPEQDAGFYTRVSEQLRHKGRAVTLFDYEQLILEAFPDLYKVKCITHTFAPQISGAKQADFADRQTSAGYVTIVAIPNVLHLPQEQRLEPRASRAQLDLVKTFLQDRISPFVRLRVMNPLFEHINTSFQVQFKTGKSPDFYKELLRKELEQFLAPWAFSPDAPIAFSGTVFKSSLVGFIENREYVDFIKDFIMFKETDDPTDEITTDSARAILVSGSHDINLINS